jgi:hypothetical protein
MKRKLIMIGVSLFTLLIIGFATIYVWIDFSVKKNIKAVKENYQGTAEDALIAYLLDNTNSPQNRSHIAVWTLGQINSKKAIPVLNKLYKNDPTGMTCKGKHDSELCQYEIYKALNAATVNWWPLHARLNK